MRLNNLGFKVIQLYRHTKDIECLKLGIEILEDSVEKTHKFSPSLPRHLNNLGFGLYHYYIQTGNTKDWQRVTEAFERAAKIGLEVSVQWSLISARNWINLAFTHQVWEDIAQAYKYAYQAIDKLLRIQLFLRSYKETWLSEIQGLSAKVAYALAKVGELEQAALALEQGLAYLLSESLELNRADLEYLKNQDSSKKLYSNYWQLQQLQQQLQQQLTQQTYANSIKKWELL
ncbi:MAG: hypothetical protein DRR19_19595 [Candidatus Parabeggiatoa sp. nov. 1]|nr:MAG: hypothetical protein DRR19_19595 [Gammaproteobacteria bacterium]